MNPKQLLNLNIIHAPAHKSVNDKLPNTKSQTKATQREIYSYIISLLFSNSQSQNAEALQYSTLAHTYSGHVLLPTTTPYLKHH
jgi:hypothetical protein